MLKENGNTPAIFDVNTITAFRMNVSATDESDLVKNQKVTKSMTKSKNKSIEEIADDLEEDVSTIEKICNVASKFAPEYDVDSIMEALEKE